MSRYIWIVALFAGLGVTIAVALTWRALIRTEAPADNWPTTSWRTAAPEAHGWDSEKLAAGLRETQANGIAVHSLMLVRGGEVFLDAYFDPYDGTLYHDLGSVTKSVMTTLIGIAADQGRLSLDDPVLSFFPGRIIANREERKERLTVRHLAGMTSGLACTPANDEQTLQEMRASADWVQFTLDLPMVREPGARFEYCSPGMHLLSAILRQATGLSALEFAQAYLFGPLGIQSVYWPADAQGNNHGWGDLCLRPPDAARIGYLFLREGQWAGQTIVSKEWVAAATQPLSRTSADRAEDYGLGWWVSRADAERPLFRADGRRGQTIVVLPDWDLVLVTTGGGFETTELNPYLLPAFTSPNRALPANPAGVEHLAAAVAEITRPPDPQPIKPFPGIAWAISGQAYGLEPNVLQARSLRLDFGAAPLDSDAALPAEATLTLEIAGEPAPRVAGIGLDGVYRASQVGRPTLARGGWADDETFGVEYSEGPGLSFLLLRVSFEADRVEFELRNYDTGLNVRLEGQAQQP
jgi:CubicO group peptidase (beta-lactamase class C family)